MAFNIDDLGDIDAIIGQWEAYEPANAACGLEEALDIIEIDSYGCFFG